MDQQTYNNIKLQKLMNSLSAQRNEAMDIAANCAAEVEALRAQLSEVVQELEALKKKTCKSPKAVAA